MLAMSFLSIILTILYSLYMLSYVKTSKYFTCFPILPSRVATDRIHVPYWKLFHM